jgi:hypothetical protein
MILSKERSSITPLYCDGFAHSIARQRPSKHIPAQAPRNNTVDVFALCPRTDRGNVTQQWVAITWHVFSVIRVRAASI